MTPAFLLSIVLVLIILDFVFDLQLFGVSIAASFFVIAILQFYEVTLDNWVWTVLFAVITVFFAVITRVFVKKTDNEDINKY